MEKRIKKIEKPGTVMGHISARGLHVGGTTVTGGPANEA
jgi:hypothetical protein